MPTMRVQHIYNPKSGLPIDRVVNTFYFSSGSGGAAVNATTAAQVAALVINFYNLPNGANSAPRSYISEATMTANRETIKVYNMDDAEPRVPVLDSTLAPGTVNNSLSALPSEVCICLSYRAAITSGVNMKRRRGRLYMGPLSPNAIIAGANGEARPVDAMRNAWLAAALKLQDDAVLIGWAWSVYSPTRHAEGTLDQAMAAITYCWVDNAFDTQRRRGQAPTGRLSQVVEVPG